jgi:hypothetical protein
MKLAGFRSRPGNVDRLRSYAIHVSGVIALHRTSSKTSAPMRPFRGREGVRADETISTRASGDLSRAAITRRP